MASDAEILRHMRWIVEGGWTDTIPAEDRNGKAVSGRDQRAVRWSLRGALTMALPGAFSDEEQRQRIAVLDAFGGSLGKFDGQPGMTEDRILAAVDAAILEVGKQ